MKSKVGTVESLGCLHLFDSSVAILAQAGFSEVPLPALDPILVMRPVYLVPPCVPGFCVDGLFHTLVACAPVRERQNDWAFWTARHVF